MVVWHVGTMLPGMCPMAACHAAATYPVCCTCNMPLGLHTLLAAPTIVTLPLSADSTAAVFFASAVPLSILP